MLCAFRQASRIRSNSPRRPGSRMNEHRTVADSWDRYGRERPEFAVLTDGRTGTEFYESGRTEVSRILAIIGELGFHPRGQALDLGCGLGRLTFALAPRFDSVVGVDHSAAMLEHARSRGNDLRVSNARFVRAENGRFPQVGTATIDFTLSRLVFQHMPSVAMIASNLTELARTLRPGGLAWLQFDTRPQTLLYQLWDWIEPHLPQGIGPETRRAPLRRYRRRPIDLEGLLGNLRLEILHQFGRNSESHE